MELFYSLVRDCATRMNRPITGVSTAAERVLQQNQSEGNIRELRNVIARACLLSEARMLSERDVLAAMPRAVARGAVTSETAAVPRDVETMAEPEGLLVTAQRAEIERVLKQVAGNKSEAARLLGISRRSLYRWLERLDLEPPRPASQP